MTDREIEALDRWIAHVESDKTLTDDEQEMDDES